VVQEDVNKDFDTALSDFLQDSQKKIDDNNTKYTYVQRNKLDKLVGPKYVKIVDVLTSSEGKVISRSAWAFVDKETGDVFKPASWKAPAKHARANIYKPDSWKTVSVYGPAYLR
jgi:hypothetical protein